ncbi:tropomyosin-like [Erythrolamprus reginae]|uniref:tropomyosin-like n=1 Tax=Erythrolamprus reginae TaxID=121349 RepID=UPI00396C30EB
MLAKEKEKEKEKSPADPNFQSIQDALAGIQDFMQKSQTQTQTQLETNKEEMKKYLEEMRQEMKEMKNEIKKELTEVKGNIAEMDGNIKVIQQNLQESEKRIKVTEEKIQAMGQKVEEYEDHDYDARRGFDIAITNLELQSISHGLKFQNIEEERDKDLSAKMVEVIGGIMQADPAELIREIDEVYRVQTGYVRRHNLPREVFKKNN